MNKKRHGTCHLCGEEGKLSFEHVPPQSAFNDRPVLLSKFEDVYENLETPSGTKQQKGMGDYTLCERCNNNTGSWYGGAFCEWARQVMVLLQYTDGNPLSLPFTYRIYPLRVLKQVLCLFFSTHGSRWRQVNPELEHFVLNKHALGIAPRYSVWTYFNTSQRSRQTGLAATVPSPGSTSSTLLSEISFPPIGYLMTFQSDPPPDPRLVDISFMANYGYDEQKEITLNLPVLPVYTYFPGDYRDRETVRREAGESDV